MRPGAASRALQADRRRRPQVFTTRISKKIAGLVLNRDREEARGKRWVKRSPPHPRLSQHGRQEPGRDVAVQQSVAGGRERRMIWKETLSCGLGDWGDLDGVAELLEAPDQTAGLLAAGAAVVMIGTEIRVEGAVRENMPAHPPQVWRHRFHAVVLPRARQLEHYRPRVLTFKDRRPHKAQGFDEIAKTTSTTRSPASAAWSDPEGRAPCSAE
jgi:hypothetical protein